jgi:hypothetical protein
MAFNEIGLFAAQNTLGGMETIRDRNNSNSSSRSRVLEGDDEHSTPLYTHGSSDDTDGKSSELHLIVRDLNQIS